MRNAIIVHGTSSKREYYDSTASTLGNAHWGPWITKQLMINDISVAKLEIPNAYDEHIQDYDVWRREFERFDAGPETIVIGHSFGVGFLLRWLSENKEVQIDQLMLLAPWLDPNKEYGDFFDFRIDPAISQRVNRLVMFSSVDDDSEVQDGVQCIKDIWPEIRHVEFQDKGHFTEGDLGTKEFPELLEEILNHA